MDKVHIVVSRLMNNFGILPQGIVIGGKRVFFHNDPRMSADGDTVHFNFDYMITDGTIMIDSNVDAESIVPAHMLSITKRYNKFEQMTRLRNFATEQAKKGKFDIDNFIVPGVWYNKQQSGLSNLVIPDEEKVIVKPVDGARGIGQFMVKLDKIPFVVFVETLDRYRLEKITEEQFWLGLNKFSGCYVYSTAGEHYENEGLASLKNQGYMVQGFVKDVCSEYRLLTDLDGKIAYCQMRGIRDKDQSEFPQATGSDTNSIEGSDIVPIEEVVNKRTLRDLNAVASKVVGPLSSIDLFLTEDDRWGIFEYCNQFGIKGVPMETTFKLHYDFVERLIGDK